MRERRRVERVKPTPERLAKGNLELSPQYAPSGFVERINYTQSKVLKRYERGWPSAIPHAFEQYAIDKLTLAQDRITLDDEKLSQGTYGCSCSSSPFGGVGVSKARHIAAHRDHFITSQLKVFDVVDGIPVLYVLDAVLLRIQKDGFGQRFTLADMGRQIFPALREETTARGIAIGSLTMVGRFLAGLYLRYWATYGPHLSSEVRPISEDV